MLTRAGSRLRARTVGDSGEKSIKTSKISDTTPPAPPPPGPAVGTTKAVRPLKPP